MQARTPLFLTAALALGLASPALAGDTPFEKAGCNDCHTVDSKGIKKVPKEDGSFRDGADLSKIPADLDQKSLVDWLLKKSEREVEGKKTKHKKKFAGSPDELKAVIAWVLTLK